tara:strand:- start:524 stop:1009 length:486 start_codon:yes stop_codon:yes gene_type:complete
MSKDSNNEANTDNLDWSGSPSQWYNFPKFSIWGFISLVFLLSSPNIIGGLIAALIPIAIIVWNYLKVMMWKINISEEKLVQQKGVLNLKTDELQIYRVKDISLEQPIWLRLVGLSNISLISSDKSDPFITIPAISDGDILREKISTAVEKMRRKKGVREFD